MQLHRSASLELRCGAHLKTFTSCDPISSQVIQPVCSFRSPGDSRSPTPIAAGMGDCRGTAIAREYRIAEINSPASIRLQLVWCALKRNLLPQSTCSPRHCLSIFRTKNANAVSASRDRGAAGDRGPWERTPARHPRQLRVLSDQKSESAHKMSATSSLPRARTETRLPARRLDGWIVGWSETVSSTTSPAVWPPAMQSMDQLITPTKAPVRRSSSSRYPRQRKPFF